MRLAVITVNYRCADVIVENLISTASQIAQSEGFWYIVDNSSPDNSVAMLRSALREVDNVELIEANYNGGFGYGNNRVIERVIAGEIDSEYVYLLNPDASPEPGTIEQMVRYLDDFPNVGVVGSALTNSDGSPADSMFRFPSVLSEIESTLAIGPISRLLAHRITALPLSAAGPVGWVSGASLMIRADVLRAVGAFDEGFFLYWEEVELCHRVRAKGFQIHGLPAAKVRHIGGVSTGMGGQVRVPDYWHQSRNLYFRRTGTARSTLILNLLTAFTLAVGRCWQWLRRKPGKPPRFLRDHLRNAVTFNLPHHK